MRFGFLAVLPVLLAPVSLPAYALDDPGTTCAGIDADADRLACYDALFPPTGTSPNADAVVFTSEQLIPARPTGRAPATMTVSCADGNLTIAFSFAGHTLSATGRDSGITLQADVQAARTTVLPVSPDNTAMLITGSGAAAAFLDTLEGATNLTVRTTPFSYRSLSVRFRIDDAAAKVAPVRAACE